MSGQAARSGLLAAGDGYGLGHAACRRARLSAPGWQEVAKAIRPALRGLPAPAVEACARALLAETAEIAQMGFPPAPYDARPREEFQRALLAGACQALRHGEQVVVVRQSHDGTWEADEVRIPPVYPREPQHGGAASTRRPALRLVADGHQPSVRVARKAVG